MLVNRIEFLYGVDKFYNNSLKVFEGLFEKYSFVFYQINKLERVYVVEDSFIVYFGIKQTCPITEDFLAHSTTDGYGQIQELLGHIVIVEELTYNEMFKINASKLKRDIFQERHRYAPFFYKFFDGQKNSPVKKLNWLEEERFNNGSLSHFQSNFNIVNERFPLLNLDDRINNWKGFPHTFIIYEVNRDGKTGYAVNDTTSPYVTQFALDSIHEFEKSVRNHFTDNMKQSNKEDTNFVEVTKIDNHVIYSFPYAIRKILGQELCYNDANFKYVLTHLLEEYYTNKNTSFKKSSELSPKFIPNNVMRYWTFLDYAKSSYFPEKYIDILKRPQKYISQCNNMAEYIKTENKWKSEELVFEYTKKLFNKHQVIYQHRPYFLRTYSGQMSYDVFVCGENIAIEYQGKQHFEPVEFFGGQKHFEEQRKRDALKREKSEQNGVILIYVNYWEEISLELIRSKVEEEYKKRNIIKNAYFLK